MDSVEQRIIQAFIASGDEFISGTRLATRFAISRVSVWSHMEKLRTEGYEFEGRPRRGYRLIKTPDRLSADYLRALLARKEHASPLFFHDSVDSTNSEADRLLAQGEKPPFVVAARSQTRGRGRLGREWFSGDDGNLYLTFAFAPGLSPARMQTFTLWMGVSICDFLHEFVPEIMLKWPNDLQVNGKKLGGMLTEARVDADHIRDLAFGLGINVNGQPAKWPEELRRIATSIAAARGSPVSLNEFAASLIDCIGRAYHEFLRGDVQDQLDTGWKRFDSLAGKHVQATIGTTPVSGIAGGIDSHGRLLIRAANGETISLSAGDVTLAKSP